MKTRRMVSKLIYDSERFLKMSVSARDLYTYLILHADDDGVVEAGTVLRLTKGADDDLNLLIYKNFITMLDPENKVVYVNDWLLHNTIRADRKTNSVYKDLLLQILPNVKIVDKKQRADRIPKLEEEECHNLYSLKNKSNKAIVENEEKILDKISNLFKKFNIDKDALKFFKKKFSNDLILKQLQNLEIEIERGTRIENISAWLFVACDRNYPLKTRKCKNISDSKMDTEENNITIDNIAIERKKRQLKLLEDNF